MRVSLGRWGEGEAAFTIYLAKNLKTSARLCYSETTDMLAADYHNLGRSLQRQGKRAEALAAFAQALRSRPDVPEFACDFGNALLEAGRLDQAAACYRRALRLRPGYVEASSKLATALLQLGFVDEGAVQARETLRVQSDHALMYFYLGELVAEGRCDLTGKELEHMKASIASPSCVGSDRILYCFALAATLKKQGNHDEAFAYYRQANDLKKRQLHERNIRFDAQGFAALVGQISAAYDRAYFERAQGWGTDTDLPVFIIGMPRSGSTLVEHILASHPHVFGGGELGQVPVLMNRMAPHEQGQTRDSALPMLPDKHAARQISADYCRWLAQHGRGASRVTNKTLSNFLFLGVIATLFPRARLIHCRRDPRDLCLSCFFTNFQDVDFAWSLEDIGTYYRCYEELMGHWSRVLPVRIHSVCYEELIYDQETVTRELLAFCGLDWDDRCLAFYDTRRAVRTASTIQVRKPMSTQAIGRWRHYRAHLGPLYQALGISVEM